MNRRIQSIIECIDFDIDNYFFGQNSTDVAGNLSVSGVQEKVGGIVENGKLRLVGKDERSTHILKPAPQNSALRDRKYLPANEHLTMQIASQVYGITTATNYLCFTPKGHMVYVTQRFDINEDGSKSAMEDFASLIGKDETGNGAMFKYRGSYRDIAMVIRERTSAWMVEMERFFELITFNYIYGNGDAHLKNFSLILKGRDYRLSPAYDLINTALHIDGDDFALEEGLGRRFECSDAMARTGHATYADFRHFAAVIGLVDKRAAKILDKYLELPDKVVAMVTNSYLTKKLQRSYLRIVRERIDRFNREN